MDRRELLNLSRDELLRRAESAGVASPRTLSQPELVDEILLRAISNPSERQTTRGWFGRARDLLKSVIDLGLHLPDAAARVKKRASVPPPASERLRDAYPTVTLAEIYVGQGHTDKARSVLEQVLAREPEHGEARMMLARLDADDAARASRPAPARPAAASDAAASTLGRASTEASLTDEGPLPEHYDVDEVVAIAVDPSTAYVYWEVRPTTLAEAKARHAEGRLVMRVLTVTASQEGPLSQARDITVDALFGDVYVSELDPGTNLRVSVGWRWGEASEIDSFEPFAVGLELSTPRATPDMLASMMADLATPATAADVSKKPVVRVGGPLTPGAPHAGAPTVTPGQVSADAWTVEHLLADRAGPPVTGWTRTVLWRGGAGVPIASLREDVSWIEERAGASDLVRRRHLAFGFAGASELGRGGASDLLRGGASDLARAGARAAAHEIRH